jgi:hypothetical protein
MSDFKIVEVTHEQSPALIHCHPNGLKSLPSEALSGSRRAAFNNPEIDEWLVMRHHYENMSLYLHQLFTIDLTKVIAVYQNEGDSAFTIQTDDQRKIEVAAPSPETAVESLNDFAAQWEKAAGSLLRHANHVFLPAAIYSIQAENEVLYINFRDQSVSFELGSAEQTAELLGQLSQRWQLAIGSQR